ncbi:MAG: oxidoreductase [Spirochaetaceae bacterium]
MNDRWTINNIDKLDGKIIIVTGGNSGLGFESVKVFAGKGAKVILASRSVNRGEEAKKQILDIFPNAKIDVMQLDLSSLKSVKKFVTLFLEKYNRLDILLNNAGIMTTPYGLTADGFEQQLGVNHLGHFALTGQLFDVIKNSGGARIVNISSMAHKSGVMDFENLMFEGGKDYTPMKAYGRSKLANLLFTYELQRKVEDHNLDIKVLAAHPGVSNTNLARHLEGKFLFKILKPLFELITQSPFDGALPGIRASIDSDVISGTYYGPSGRREMTGDPIIVQSNTLSHNLEDAKQLWSISEELTSISYTL